MPATTSPGTADRRRNAVPGRRSAVAAMLIAAASLHLPTQAASPGKAAVAPQPALAVDCTVDHQPASGPYSVHNNQWGRDGVTAAFSQCVGIGPLNAQGGVAARWTWQWPAGPNEIKGYPGIGYGAKPGHQAPPSALPLRVDAIRAARTRWATRTQVSGRGQLAYDLWLTRDDKVHPCFNCAPITHEIMVALEPYGGYGLDRNPAWLQGTIRVGEQRFRLYKADQFGVTGWRFIVLQALAPMPAGELDIKAMLEALRLRGLITGKEYLASIELGSEPVEGRGDVQVDHFSVEIN